MGTYLNADAIARDLAVLIESADEAREMVDRARALHRPGHQSPRKCERDAEVWPCATITALGGPDEPPKAAT